MLWQKLKIKKNHCTILHCTERNHYQEKDAALGRENERFAPTINGNKNNRESNTLHDNSLVQTAQTMNTSICMEDVQNVEG